MRRIADTKGGLFHGASSWILGHEGFRRWHDTDDARLLWVKGDPGKGKTMLLITAVEALEQEVERPPTATEDTENTALSYFFCQATEEKLNNAVAVLRGLVYLLCAQQPWLASHLRARYDQAGTKLFNDANTFYSLARVLESILCDKRLKRLYLVVDALDECVVGRDQLLRLISDHAVASSRIKWIVSSRNVPEIEDALEINSPDDSGGYAASAGSDITLSLEVTQNAEQVERAVEAFIDHKLSNIRSLHAEQKTKRQLQDAIRKKANGTFLWVALVVNELGKAPSYRMLELVEKVPATLEAFYALMMDSARQSNEREWEHCQLVLAAAALAYRPLHLAELAMVSGLPPDIFAGHANRVQEVIALCGSFLTVREGVVYLIHQSVQDYLKDKAAAAIFPSGIGRVHREIFTRSVEGLSTGLRRDIYGLLHPGVPISDVKTPEPDPLATLRYSCIHWARHFCDAASAGSLEVTDLETIDRFIRGFFIYWLEAISLLRSMPASIVSIQQLSAFLEVSGKLTIVNTC